MVLLLPPLLLSGGLCVASLWLGEAWGGGGGEVGGDDGLGLGLLLLRPSVLLVFDASRSALSARLLPLPPPSLSLLLLTPRPLLLLLPP